MGGVRVRIDHKTGTKGSNGGTQKRPHRVLLAFAVAPHAVTEWLLGRFRSHPLVPSPLTRLLPPGPERPATPCPGPQAAAWQGVRQKDLYPQAPLGRDWEVTE